MRNNRKEHKIIKR